jgi:ribosomal protein S17
VCRYSEDEQCKVGDVVKIEACRPMSKTKKFKFLKVVVK